MDLRVGPVPLLAACLLPGSADAQRDLAQWPSDPIAAAAELVKGNTSRIPVAVVRGIEYAVDEMATMAPVLRDSSRDLFR